MINSWRYSHQTKEHLSAMEQRAAQIANEVRTLQATEDERASTVTQLDELVKTGRVHTLTLTRNNSKSMLKALSSEAVAVTSLILEPESLTSETLPVLLLWMSAYKKLTHLTLSKNNLSSAINFLKIALMANNGLSKLFMRDCNLDDKVISELLCVIAALPSLVQLGLGANSFSLDGLIRILNAFTSKSSSRKLFFSCRSSNEAILLRERMSSQSPYQNWVHTILLAPEQLQLVYKAITVVGVEESIDDSGPLTIDDLDGPSDTTEDYANVPSSFSRLVDSLLDPPTQTLVELSQSKQNVRLGFFAGEYRHLPDHPLHPGTTAQDDYSIRERTYKLTYDPNVTLAVGYRQFKFV